MFQSTIILIILFSIVYRWSISMNSYSGQAKPKMFGDYEAQRHWMEITFNLKINDWYRNTSDNDLNYWGLDYPPLTAYHSYIMGYLADSINPSFVKLHESRGLENEKHKLFMRFTVLVFDLLIFFSSVVLILNQIFFNLNDLYEHSINEQSKIDNLALKKDYLASLFFILLNPTLVLIDHGHFQYNSISLGLMQLSFYFALLYKSNESIKKLNTMRLMLCSFFFCLALNYKQMELYHALPIFFYLLAICFKSNIFSYGLCLLTTIGSTVIFTFGILWYPFIDEGFNSVIQVLIRIFPINRGLFEDKVANFWCSLSPILKLKQHFAAEHLAKISFLITIIFNLPSSLNLLFKPSRQCFLLALIISALTFYLFSFQVHEKSIIISTVPACLLVNFYPQLISWFILIANFSMLPLFIKDGLILPFITTSVLFNLTVYIYYHSKKLESGDRFWLCLIQLVPQKFSKLSENIFKSLYFISLSGMLLLTVCTLAIRPPDNLPDLWTLLICVYSFVHFAFFLCLFNLIQFTLKNNDLIITERNTQKSQRLFFNFESILSEKKKCL